MILVDTNAWIAHARRADVKLIQYLESNRVVACDVVVGELSLGSGLPPTMSHDLARLPNVPSPTAAETRHLSSGIRASSALPESGGLTLRSSLQRPHPVHWCTRRTKRFAECGAGSDSGWHEPLSLDLHKAGPGRRWPIAALPWSPLRTKSARRLVAEPKHVAHVR